MGENVVILLWLDPNFCRFSKKTLFFFVFRSYSKSFWWCLCCFAINLTIFMWKVISTLCNDDWKFVSVLSENVTKVLWLDPNFCRFSKKTLFFFRFSVVFNIVVMVFVLFCHHLDNIHVKGNFILFAMTIESSWVFCRKTSQYYFDWTPTFAVLAKKHYFFSFFGRV